MTVSLLKSIFAAMVVLVVPGSLFALDGVTKKSDGKKISGTISAMSKTEVTIKRPQGEEPIPANDIASIDWDGASPELKLAYTDENNGKFDLALQRFLKAKSDSKSSSSYLAGEFEYIQARIAARQAQADPEKSAAAIQKLLAAQKSNPDHIRYYESVMLLSQLQLAAKDSEGIKKSLDILKKSPWGDMKLAASLIEAHALMNDGNIDEAISAFEAASRTPGDTPAEQARRFDAVMGQARGLIAKMKFEEAIKLLESIIDRQTTEDDTALQAEAHILQGHALKGLGHNLQAANAYLYVDLLCSKEAGFHAEALYEMSILWKVVKHPDRSAEAAGKLVQNYPNSEWRKKLVGGE